MTLMTFLWIMLIVLGLPVLLDFLAMCGDVTAKEDPALAQKQQVRDRRLLRLCLAGFLLVAGALAVDWVLGKIL